MKMVRIVIRAWLVRSRWLPRFFTPDVELDDVIAEQQSDRPIQHDTKSPIESGHAKEVIGPPNPPGEESTNFEFVYSANPLEMAESGQRSLGLIDERFERLAVNGGRDVLRQLRPLADGMLREHGIRVAVRIGD